MNKWMSLILACSLLIALTLPISTAFAAGKVIEDPILEAAVKKALKIAERELTEADLLSLTSLYPQGEGKITTLKGLEHAENLTNLFLPNEEISDLSPLQTLHSLRMLALNNNRIENVCPVSHLFQLNQLILSNNQIKSIDCLSQNSQLTDLLVGSNQIQDITAVANLPLKWLSLENNKVSDIGPLQDHPTMETVDLSGNQIRDIRPLLTLPKLKTAIVAKNPLAENGNGVLQELAQKGINSSWNKSQDEPQPQDISAKIDGKKVAFDKDPFIREGSTLVQFRPLFEAFGLKIQWDPATQTIVGEKPGFRIELKAGSPVATINGAAKQLSQAPEIIDGSTFVPVRFIGETLQCDVVWEDAARTVQIYTAKQEFSSVNGRGKFLASHKWVSETPPYRALQFDVYATSETGALLFLEDNVSFTDKKITSLDDYMTTYFDQSKFPQGKVSKPESVFVNGLHGMKISYTYDSEYLKSKILLLVIQGKSGFYRLAIYTTEENDEAAAAELMDMAQTFREEPALNDKITDKFGGKSAEARIQDAFAYFKQMGFFENADERQLESDFLVKYGKEFKGQEYDPFAPESVEMNFADLYVLASDKNRVWFEDTEMDVGKGNDKYVEVLKQWAKISRGAFNPVNIVETWSTDNGPVKLEFELNGEKVTLYPAYMNDFLDTGILQKINAKMKGTGFRFVEVVLDQTVFITVLNEKEEAKIRDERLWQIED